MKSSPGWCVALVCLAAQALALAQEPPASRSDRSAVTAQPGNPIPHEQFLARARSEPVGMLFLGDSILAGWPLAAPENWKKFEAAQPANFSVPGETTEQMLWRITHGELDGIKPRVVVILIGTNNIGHFPDEKPEWAAAGIRKIVETVRARLPKSQVVVLGLLPRGRKDSPERKKVAAVNQIISQLDDGKNVRYVDVGDEFLDKKGKLRKTRMRDGLHPTHKGYDVIEEALEPVLREKSWPFNLFGGVGGRPAVAGGMRVG